MVQEMIEETTEKERTAKEQPAEDESALKETTEIKPKKEKKKSSGKKTEKKKPLKPLFSYANVVYTGIVFAAISAALLFLPRSEKSDIEQRTLKKFPEFNTEDFLNGTYTNGITDYYADTIPFRDELKKMGSRIKKLYGISAEEGEIVGQAVRITTQEEDEPPEVSGPAAETDEVTADTAQTSETAAVSVTVSDTGTVLTDNEAETAAPETSATTAETTAAPEQTATTAAEKNLNEIAPGVMTNGQVVTKLSDGHWWGISLYGGGKGTVYADTLNRFRELLPENVNIYSMVVPTAGEYYLPDTYSDYSASHQDSIDSINARLSDGIIPVPASERLWQHINEPIYTRTDHHWQPLGAYYAAQTLAEAAGVPFAELDTMERVDIEGYVGTMYSFTEKAQLLEDPETFTYYKPSNGYTTYYYNTEYIFDYQFPFFLDMPVSGSYSTFMGGDKKIVRIETDVANGRKLLVFKDSYGNAEIPFYFGSFEEVIVCDMRYFDLDPIKFIEDMGVTDLLFTMCTFSAVGANANSLAALIY